MCNNTYCFSNHFQDGLSSVHHAVQAGHLETLRTLLDRLKLAGITRDSDTAHQLVAVTDHSGWTLAHMAAHLPKQVPALTFMFSASLSSIYFAIFKIFYLFVYPELLNSLN